jgi:hypothetical protein
MKNRLFKLEHMVLQELLNKPRTRDDDRELTLAIHTDYYGINPWAPYGEVMRDKDIPSQESIGRCRRKLQAEREDLRGSKYKEQVRMAEQITFIEYANADTSTSNI